MLAYRRLDKALDNRIGLLLTGNVYLAFGNTPTRAININSASERRAIDKHLTG